MIEYNHKWDKIMANAQKLIIGNWKMNFTVDEASHFLHKLALVAKPTTNVEVVLAPALFSIQSLSLQVNRKQFKLAAQNFYHRDFGAFTGETSIAQLRGFVDYALVGHSERRYIFDETTDDTRLKVAAALRSGVKPILCIGETESEKSRGETNDVIYDQLLGGLREVTSEDIVNVVIAYEPIWAKEAKLPIPDEIANMVKLIRKHIEHLYGKKAAEAVRVVYGGSIDSSTAEPYLKITGVDGLLVGGASLNTKHFCEIIDISNKLTRTTRGGK
ncbi:MAG: triose-phosphate isomerase [Candidatus Nomurabacteria bacterium]|jgi:triosephosphate isomerase|nr:triose-phosphate isomerase [Candidatus Nomurabacteria bacterium]